MYCCLLPLVVLPPYSDGAGVLLFVLADRPRQREFVVRSVWKRATGRTSVLGSGNMCTAVQEQCNLRRGSRKATKRRSWRVCKYQESFPRSQPSLLLNPNPYFENITFLFQYLLSRVVFFCWYKIFFAMLGGKNWHKWPKMA